eukprot:6640045-Heterocapsa_arctica.AAC.1
MVLHSNMALLGHMNMIHKVLNTYRAVVITNQCPFCERPFSFVNCAKFHASQRQNRQNCNSRTPGRSFE